MKPEFANIAQNFNLSADQLFNKVQQFCENAISVIDEEKRVKLLKVGKKLFNTLEILEDALKKEYLNEINDTIKDGQNSATFLCNGFIELMQAAYYAKQAVGQANILLSAKDLTSQHRKQIKSEISANLKKVKEHGAKGISLIIEGVSLAAKTIDKVKNLATNISGLFNAISTVSFSLDHVKESKPKTKAHPK